MVEISQQMMVADQIYAIYQNCRLLVEEQRENVEVAFILFGEKVVVVDGSGEEPMLLVVPDFEEI